MPYCYIYQCPTCQLDVEIAVAREFCYDAAGERVDYEYSPKGEEEWPPKQVAGLWSRLWCPQCRAIRSHVLLEMATPSANPAHAFFEAEARRMTGMEVGPCPACGETLTLDAEDAPCPGCGEGRLSLIGEYEP